MRSHRPRENPVAFYPAVEEFIGEGGTYTHPEPYMNISPVFLPSHMRAAEKRWEHFVFRRLRSSRVKRPNIFLLLGVEDSDSAVSDIFEKYNTPDKVRAAFEETRSWWAQESQCKLPH